MNIFTLPDLGEGLPDAEIVNWHVEVGDFVKLDQILVSVETAKAVVEIPSPMEGLIQKLFGKAGDLVHTGAPLVEFDISTGDSRSGTSGHNSHVDSDRRDNVATAAGELEIGDTVIQDQSHLHLQKQINNLQANKAHVATSFNTGIGSNIGTNIANVNSNIGTSIKATPAVRARAQELQIDLASVIGTGPNGTITKQDLEKATSALQATDTLQQSGSFEQLKGVRRAMAHSMAKSHAEVVPITIMDDAKLLNWPEKEDITVRIIQAIVAAYQIQPDLNAWFDSKAMARRVIKELNLGIAMDTEDGLFVPVIHNAEKLNKTELRAELEKLKKQVHDRTISPNDLRGATFTLSNVGIFSGRYANPVVLPPTVAILAAGKIREEVVAIKGEIRICKVLPLALTFDHRVVTGGEATRFMAAVMQSLE